MKSTINTDTKNILTISYSIYAVLFSLGLNLSSKGTIYLKELIEFIILNNLYDYQYNKILELFITAKHYETKNIKNNIKNSLYRINFSKAKKNFELYLNLEFDSYYLSPSKFINIIALKYRD